MILAIAHPLRRRILRALSQDDETLTALQLGRHLEGPAGRIAYHVRILRRLAALEPVEEQRTGDDGECAYASTVKGDRRIERLLEETRKEDEEEE